MIKIRLNEAVDHLFPAADELRLERERLYRLNARHRLDEEGLPRRCRAPDRLDLLLKNRKRQERLCCKERHDDERDQRELNAVEEHHSDERDREKRIENRRERRSRKEFTDAGERSDAHHRVADTAMLKIRCGKRDEVAKEPGA